MKLLNYIYLLSAGVAATCFTSCQNQNFEFDNYEGGSSVYFAYQYPVRTLVMGEDTYDTSLDNAHKCKIYATMGGVYENKNNIRIDIAADNSLCDKLFFEDGSPVKAMPAEYYSIANEYITLNKVLSDGVEIKFTDEYFADPDALTNTYVIPVKMTYVSGADRIIAGTPLIEGSDPHRSDPSGWNVKPKDYVLYCVKYINEWDGYYLRRGVDKMTKDNDVSTVTRNSGYVEYDEVCKTYTKSLKTLVFPVTTEILVNEDGVLNLKELTCELLLSFDDKGKCTITSATDEFKASGSGKFVKNGERKAWGNKDRDALYLDYKIDFNYMQYETKDTLVARNRGISSEVFSPSYVE